MQVACLLTVGKGHMRRLLYLAVLSMLAMMIIAPAAMAQGDVDCPQLTFEEAQAILAADPSDPNRLDADGDGIACDRSNTLPSQPTPQPQPKMEEQPKMEQTMPKEMPKTGGPAVGSLLPVSALLVGAGILGFAVLRRR